jgi:hypothetical protein
MGLDFSTIKDQDGAAVYIIHDGSMQNAAQMERLASDVKGRTSKQVVVISAKDDNGRKIIDFYDLEGNSNIVLLVRDDDQIHQMWRGNEIPGADQIAYFAEQVG